MNATKLDCSSLSFNDSSESSDSVIIDVHESTEDESESLSGDEEFLFSDEEEILSPREDFTGLKSRGNKKVPPEQHVSREIAEIRARKDVEIVFPDPCSLKYFEVNVSPQSGYWQGAVYTFLFVVPDAYPQESLKVACLTPIFHPNIDFSGNISEGSLNGARNIKATVQGLVNMLEHPTSENAVNSNAAQLFLNDKEQFLDEVRRTAFLSCCSPDSSDGAPFFSQDLLVKSFVFFLFLSLWIKCISTIFKLF